MNTDQLDLELIPGIGPHTARMLKNQGLNLALLRTMPVQELEEKYGIPMHNAEKYHQFIGMNTGWFENANSILKRKRSQKTITFGTHELDDAFFIPEFSMGGIRNGETYEFFGPFSSGKTQLCHQLAVTCQLPVDLGGINKKVIYIDTEGTFSPSRILQIANSLKSEYNWNKSTEKILEDIIVAKADSSDNQQSIIEKLLHLIGEKPNDYGLLIVDSVTSHFRGEYARKNIIDRQQVLNYHLNTLQRIANSYGLSIVVTNQVQNNPNQFFGENTIAIGGNIIGHWANTRCSLRKMKSNKRLLKIIDSSVFEERECIFSITKDGVKIS